MGFISFSFSPNVTFVVQVSVRRYQSLIMCLVCLVGFEWAPHWWSRVSSFGAVLLLFCILPLLPPPPPPFFPKIRAERFSKFQHSMAIFYPKSISLRPHWFGNPIVNINASGSHTWYTVGTLTHAQTHKPLHLLESNENPEEEKKFGITTLLKDTLVSFPILPIEPQQKLDPNFFLANERVLLKWIRISLTWSSLGIFFVFSGATKLAEYVSGWGLLLLAISTAGYGIASHQLRLKAWKSKSHYSDPVGITIVLSAIFLAALFVAVLAGVYGEPIRFRRLALLTPK
eukprot:TRINITY_DN15771_c0_g1_i5.p1 TRINITY_DN15771_c0_g1~~TRINITY_DN15771_c0_g1_i5.p1  ORF type:complete len:286 (-),score=54.13 TRINITY_DN15771_c0_g1_i5:66-923(-)